MYIAIIIAVLALPLFSAGQILIPDTDSNSNYSYKIDTIRLNSDATFVRVKQFFNDSILTFLQEQIWVAKMDGDSSYRVAYRKKIIRNGRSTQWYNNGNLKSDRTFHFNKPIGTSCYWNEDAREHSGVGEPAVRCIVEDSTQRLFGSWKGKTISIYGDTILFNESSKDLICKRASGKIRWTKSLTEVDCTPVNIYNNNSEHFRLKHFDLVMNCNEPQVRFLLNSKNGKLISFKQIHLKKEFQR